ncbi:MAG TPA: MmcQ/YjbR family DNA-binding protein [Chloroflexota bacterium]|nr:MmcQ/YjbR family DNA-binding protein [Chloroflexota bacterium]
MSITPARVRKLVAGLPGAVESAHHGHPDFRVQKKIFATLSEAEDRAALRLTQLEARELAARQPTVFRLVSDREPYSYVSVQLDAVDAEQLADLLEEAWKLRAAG